MIDRAKNEPNSTQPAESSFTKPIEFLSTQAVAKRLGLSRAFFERARVEGRGPAFLKIGRRVIYDLRALEAWLAEQSRRSTSEAP